MKRFSELALFSIALYSICAVAAAQSAPATGAAQSAPASAASQPAIDYAAPDIGAVKTGEGKPSADTENWPQFRGANRDNIITAPSAAKVFLKWPPEGLKVLWSIDDLAPGYSGAAIFGGRVFLHDYDKAKQEWMIRCTSLADGKEIWRWSYKRPININHGYTRSVPATDGKVVISLDPKLVLHAFDVATGKRLWAKDLVRDYGMEIPKWYNGQCPLLDGDRVIVGLGNRALMAAFDAQTGEVIWTAPNLTAQAATHSSVIAFMVGSEKEYVMSTLKGAAGVRASDGALRWQALGRDANAAPLKLRENRICTFSVPWQPKTAQIASPLDLGDGKLLLTTGYKVGSVAIQIIPGQLLDAKVLYRLAGDSAPQSADANAAPNLMEQGIFETDCHTPILWQGHIYAVDHAVAIGDKHPGLFACLDPDGKILWRNGDATFGLGDYILAKGLIFAIEGDTGKLHLIQADPAAYHELGVWDSAMGQETWGPMAYANGKLILRGLTKIMCVQIGE